MEEDDFLGFRLDADGVPTFLYEVNGKRFEDCVQPEGTRLKRTLNGMTTRVKIDP